MTAQHQHHLARYASPELYQWGAAYCLSQHVHESSDHDSSSIIPMFLAWLGGWDGQCILSSCWWSSTVSASCSIAVASEIGIFISRVRCHSHAYGHYPLATTTSRASRDCKNAAGAVCLQHTRQGIHRASLTSRRVACPPGNKHWRTCGCCQTANRVHASAFVSGPPSAWVFPLCL